MQGSQRRAIAREIHRHRAPRPKLRQLAIAQHPVIRPRPLDETYIARRRQPDCARYRAMRPARHGPAPWPSSTTRSSRSVAPRRTRSRGGTSSRQATRPGTAARALHAHLRCPAHLPDRRSASDTGIHPRPRSPARRTIGKVATARPRRTVAMTRVGTPRNQASELCARFTHTSCTRITKWACCASRSVGKTEIPNG